MYRVKKRVVGEEERPLHALAGACRASVLECGSGTLHSEVQLGMRSSDGSWLQVLAFGSHREGVDRPKPMDGSRMVCAANSMLVCESHTLRSAGGAGVGVLGHRG